jgi:flavin reductase (DIM6/NTAB) family NADH-FMN oxidoreductase RutF
VLGLRAFRAVPVDSPDFRAALGRFASGVTVVTTRDREGKPRGITVAAFSSLSLSPPLVHVCLGATSEAAEAVRSCGRFAVNVLAEDQEEASRRFAKRGNPPEAFDGVAWRPGTGGLPLLEGALAQIECKVVEARPGGDHLVVVGEVESTAVTDGRPLLYFRGAYGKLG